MGGYFVFAFVVTAIIGAIYCTGSVDRALPPTIASSHILPYQVEEWEHGFKTSRVTATRYKNDAMGYNIGFKFPQNGNDADRSEVDDFMRKNNGWIYQGGGYYGAEAFVKFKDVTDRESADKKLRAILPDLSKLITDLGNGVKVARWVDPNAKQWPDTDAPDKTDPYWEFNNNLSVNGTPYKKVEVEPGKWQWQVVRELVELQEKQEAHRRELFFALQSRVLSDDEMKEVANYGAYLNIEPMVSYREADKQRELNEALLQQMRLRTAASR